MKTIAISGIISNIEWEEESNVTPKTLRDSLKEAAGEDILVTINSPGGLVYAGLEMFHLLKNYSGKVETRIVSLAASMGSIIALAGDKKTAESTAMYMIHNASMISFGDYRALRKDADTIEKLSGLLASIIENGTNLSMSETRRLMDEETYFYGNDIKDLGFEIVESSEDNLNSDVARAMAMTRLKSVENKITKEAQQEDMYKAAASISQTPPQKNNYINVEFGQSEKHKANKSGDKIETANLNPSRSSGTKSEIKSMDLNQLKAEHPDTYAAAVQKGVSQERDRVCAHLQMGEASGAMDTAAKAIKDGEEMTQTLTATYLTQGMNRKDVNNRQEDDAAANAADSAQDDNAEDLGEAVASLVEQKMGVGNA